MQTLYVSYLYAFTSKVNFKKHEFQKPLELDWEQTFLLEDMMATYTTHIDMIFQKIGKQIAD